MVIVLLLSSLLNGHCTLAVVTLFRYRPILLPGFQKCLQLTFQKVGFFEGHFFLLFFRALRGLGDVRWRVVVGVYVRWRVVVGVM